MVICDTPVSHGPHLWYASVMWNQQGHWIDFLRLKTTHVNAGRNDYYYQLLSE